MKFIELKNLRNMVLTIIGLGALAWICSITTEFVGYDDIKLIVRNDRIQKSIAYAITFYWNVVSDSHNVAWTNYPTVIYRPLEWVGSSIGYHIWGARSWAYHLFVNYHFHILNSVIFFFILRKIFGSDLNNETGFIKFPQTSTNSKDKKSKSKKPKLKSFNSKSEQNEANTFTVSSWLPFVIAALWVVHPLHNEAVNMLTSGVGFLWATLFCITAVLINLYVKDLTSLTGIGLVAFAWIFAFTGYHGSEMTVIAPIMLLIIFARSLAGKDFKSYKFELPKLLFSISTFLAYFVHRSHIVSESKEWMSSNLGEFFERLFVLAPQIFFHYIKLFFLPIKLSIDEHHQVVLKNAFSLYHLLCLFVAVALVVAMVYFFMLKEEKYELHNKLISGSIFFTGFSIAISLNIIPLYVLARDRYTYFFTLGLLSAILLLLDKYIFTRIRDKEEEKNKVYKISQIVLIIILVLFTIRSNLRSLDWHDGEKFWTSTINSVDDLGTKQNWRYRLMQYYNDPGTKTFKPDEKLKKQTYDEFYNFPFKYNLLDKRVIKNYFEESKNSKEYLKNKYGYIGNKTIASGIFFNATELLKKGDRDGAVKLFHASHMYFPEHFQSNLQLMIHTYGGVEPEFTEYLLARLFKEAKKNSFLAKGLMDGLFFIKHPKIYHYATQLQKIFPQTQVFNVYAFHGALMNKDYLRAYKFAKEVVKKYHEEDIFDNFILQYEAGRLNQAKKSQSTN